MIGVLMDDTDPLVTVMKVEKAPQETYADIGGLDNQIQEIKVRLGSSSGSSPCFLTVGAWRCSACFSFVLGCVGPLLLCQGFFFSCGKRGASMAARGSLVWLLLARALEHAGFSSCDTWAWLP